MKFYKDLLKVSSKDRYRFHMPGHKGKKEIYGDFGENFLEIDFTEVEGTDNLHNPKTIIKDLQNRLKEIYNTKKSYILVNGSTVGLQSAILSQTSPKEKIIIQRDCHKAVYNSMILGDLSPEYIWTDFNKEIYIKDPIDTNKLEKLIKSSDIKVVVVTYPTYYGVCSNIKKIAEITHENNGILIVDEAHGGHLKFSSYLPKPAEELGADIVVQSLHKTLPAFTQSSVLHVCSDKVDLIKLENFLNMLQSSSPSYLLMASIDKAMDYMEEKGGRNIDEIVKEIRDLKNKDKNLFIKKEKIEKTLKCSYDETKLLISLYNKGITGSELEKILRESYGIFTELWDIVYDLAYISPADNIEDLRYLFDSVKEACDNIEIQDNWKVDFEIYKPETRLSLRDAFYSDKKSINISESSNKISGDFIIPYPPGIPIICPGELIEDIHVKYFKRLIKENIEMLGIEENYISIVK